MKNIGIDEEAIYTAGLESHGHCLDSVLSETLACQACGQSLGTVREHSDLKTTKQYAYGSIICKTCGHPNLIKACDNCYYTIIEGGAGHNYCENIKLASSNERIRIADANKKKALEAYSADKAIKDAAAAKANREANVVAGIGCSIIGAIASVIIYYIWHFAYYTIFKFGN